MTKYVAMPDTCEIALQARTRMQNWMARFEQNGIFAEMVYSAKKFMNIGKVKMLNLQTTEGILEKQKGPTGL